MAETTAVTKKLYDNHAAKEEYILMCVTEATINVASDFRLSEIKHLMVESWRLMVQINQISRTDQNIVSTGLVITLQSGATPAIDGQLEHKSLTNQYMSLLACAHAAVIVRCQHDVATALQY